MFCSKPGCENVIDLKTVEIKNDGDDDGILTFFGNKEKRLIECSVCNN